MIVDTSALIAIITDEPGSGALCEALLAAPTRAISAPNRLEASIVLGARGLADPDSVVGRFLEQVATRTIDFDATHAAAAVDAWQRYGRGRHPAKLNYGDCMAYATAKLAGEPLLYVGDDFTLTDLEDLGT